MRRAGGGAWLPYLLLRRRSLSNSHCHHRPILSRFSSSAPTSLADSKDPLVDDPPSSIPTQESVLYTLKKLGKKPDQALSFFGCLTTQRSFVPGAAAYVAMLRILSSNKDHLKDFWSFLKSMGDAGHRLDDGTYLTLLANFKNHNFPSTESSALRQFHSLAAKRAASESSVKSAAEVVLGGQQGGDLDERLAGLGLSLSEDLVARILRELRGEPSKALDFFRWAAKRSETYQHGSIAYNAITRVLGREGFVAEFWSLVGEMKEKGHDMDIDTYIKLSRQFQKSKMMKEAVELYELMMDGPYKPAIQDCGILLRQIALTESPNLDLVFRVVKKYEAAGYSLSKVVYDGIHRSLTSIGKFEEAEEILEKMKQEGYEPDNITYSQLVYGLCKAKKLDEACMVLDEMEAKGCIPDVKTWTVLIQGHCSAGEVSKALVFLTQMIEKGCDADGDLLDVLVKALCSRNRSDDAYTLFVEMVERARVKPWQATYKYLIEELLRDGKLEEALKLLGSMKSHKFPPFPDPFPSYISKFGTVEDARDFIKALTVNTYPSPAAYLNVFKSFFKEARYSEAQDLLFKCPHHIRKHADISKLFGSIKAVSAV